MRILKVLALIAMSTVMMTGLVQAQINGGTPDAQNGAQGRGRPTSYEGHRRYHPHMGMRYHRHHHYHRHHTM